MDLRDSYEKQKRLPLRGKNGLWKTYEAKQRTTPYLFTGIGNASGDMDVQ